MAKAATKETKQGRKRSAKKADAPAPQANGQSVASYFRVIFKEQPRLLKERSNQPLFDRWLADHPGVTEVPGNVKSSLSNLKSILRSKMRRKGRKAADAETPGTETGSARRIPH